MSSGDIFDRLAVRELIENWALWRDSGRWELFRTVWHDDAYMMATWFQGSADDFITASMDAFERGVRITHVLGGTSIEFKAKRAIAQTRMAISQRAPVDGVLCDVTCSGRFYDFLEKRKNRWGLVLRQPIYEKDRLDPVDPAAKLKLDNALLARFPEGYRHLAYMQTKDGQRVTLGMPGLTGGAVEALYARGTAWLSGKLIAFSGEVEAAPPQKTRQNSKRA
jgi:hypothetical protein